MVKSFSSIYHVLKAVGFKRCLEDECKTMIEMYQCLGKGR